jgi:hypothetical protein
MTDFTVEIAIPTPADTEWDVNIKREAIEGSQWTVGANNERRPSL